MPKFRLSLCGLTLIGLGVSLVLNGVLYRQAVQYYKRENALALDPLSLNTYPIATPLLPNPNQPRVVFFGDSRAADWLAPQTEQFEFMNRGIGSQTTTQVRQRFAAHVAELRPDIVIVQVGINDLTTLGLFPDREAEIIQTCQENIQAIVEKIEATGAIAIVTTIFPTGRIPLIRRPVWSPAIDRAILEVNAFIHTLAREHVIIWDTFAELANAQNKMRPEYRRDELHLTPAAYDSLNQDLLPLLAKIETLP